MSNGSPVEAHPEAAASAGPGTALPNDGGWHVLHLYYRVNRGALGQVGSSGRDALRAILSERSPGVAQAQGYVLPGHKADFGLILAGADLRDLRRVQTGLEASALGPALDRVSSFYSITEVSEYVPDVEAYGAILREREGMDPEGAIYKARLNQYAGRLDAMNRQRLYPEFPEWPCVCFYPMNKLRVEPEQNWYRTPFDERMALMADHGKSGMRFAGRVSQLITASTGLDDWEWGVTLWARNFAYIKEIVYTMRFDRASAQYAQFGPFYPGYILSADDLPRELGL
jgi:peroxiredoxin